MIFHENRLLADDSHVISYLIFVEKWEKCRKNLLSAAVLIGALRVNLNSFLASDSFCLLLVTFANSLEPDQDQ